MKATLLCVVLGAALALRGQNNQGQGGNQGTQNPSSPWQQGPGYSGAYPSLLDDPRTRGMVPGGLRNSSQEGFLGLRTVYPQAQGFPALDPVSRSYSRPGGAGLQDLMGALARKDRTPAPSAPPAPESWPAWVKLPQNQVMLKRSAARAILVRSSERVWVQDPGEPAFVPLWFWDKFRVVQKGSAIEVRHMSGEFEVSMHDGAQLRSHGIAQVSFGQLDEEIVEMNFAALREVWWNGRTRLAKIVLPGGAQLEVPQARVRISAEDEIGTITNYGPNVVRYKHAFGQVELTHGQRLRFFLAPRSADAQPVALTLEGELQQEQKGRTLEVVGRGPGCRLSWSGASIAVPPGAKLVLDPLAGRDFPENKARPK